MQCCSFRTSIGGKVCHLLESKLVYRSLLFWLFAGHKRVLKGLCPVNPGLVATTFFQLRTIDHFAVSSLHIEWELLIRTAFGILFHDGIVAKAYKRYLRSHAASQLLAVCCYSSVSWLWPINGLKKLS